MASLTSRIRKLATDCRDCRFGFCCGKCLCCVPEEDVRAIVQEAWAQDDAARGKVSPSMRGTPAEIKRVVDEITRVLPTLTWHKETTPSDAPPAVRGLYIGEGSGWRVSAVEYQFEGTARYDGGAIHTTKNLVVHLMPEQAKAAVQLAKIGAAR